jgi:hypothetical protein
MWKAYRTDLRETDLERPVVFSPIVWPIFEYLLPADSESLPSAWELSDFTKSQRQNREVGGAPCHVLIMHEEEISIQGQKREF